MTDDRPRSSQHASGVLFTQLCDYLQNVMSHLHIPGVAVGVLRDGEIYAAGFGVTNVEHPLAVDADTLFQIGSITKTLTSTACLRLVDQGRLELDAPVRRYLPELMLADETVAARVTLRHLLTHTGGWAGDFFDDCGSGDDALARMVGRLAKLPQLSPLGTLWAYNNAGFYLAGHLLEVISGQAYEAAARKLVLEPVGMMRSFFFAAEAITHRVVAGHDAVYTEGVPVKVARPWALPRAGHAICGLIASVDEMLRYARFHLGGGCVCGEISPGRLDGTGEQWPLRAKVLAHMHSPQVPAANGEQMGLSWFIGEIDGVRLLRHSGATNGQAAALWLAPARDFALVVLTNSARGSELHQRAAAWALEQYLGLRQPAPTALAVPASQLEGYIGRYSAQAAERVLYVDAGSLILQVIPKGWFPTPDAPPGEPPPPVRLAIIGEDQVMALDEPLSGTRGEFLRDPAGRVAWLRMSGRLHRRESE